MIKLEYWDSFILFYMRDKFKNKKEGMPIFNMDDRMLFSAMKEHILPIIPSDESIVDSYLYTGIIDRLVVTYIPYNKSSETEGIFITHNQRIQKKKNDTVLNNINLLGSEYETQYKTEVNWNSIKDYKSSLVTAWKNMSYSDSIKYKPKQALLQLSVLLSEIKHSDDGTISRISITDLCKPSEDSIPRENRANKLTINFLKEGFSDYFGVLFYLESIELIEFGIVNELNFNFEIYIKMKQDLRNMLDNQDSSELAKQLFNYKLQGENKAIIEIGFDGSVLKFGKGKDLPLRETQHLLMNTIFKLFDLNGIDYELTYDEIGETIDNKFEGFEGKKKQAIIKGYKQSIKNLVNKIEKEYGINNFFIRKKDYIELNPEYIYNTELG